MRPTLRLLPDDLVDRILAEARQLLGTLGFEVHNPRAVKLLVDAGAKIDPASGRVRLPEALLDHAIASAPSAVPLYDVFGRQTHDLGGQRVYFTPGSAALYFLDSAARVRRPVTADYVAYAKLVSRLANLASQSTAMIPADVPEPISDSYRLFLSLLYCEKPVVTGAFSLGGLEVMKDLLLAVRGSAEALRDKPLAIFSCCPTSPLRWSEATSQNVIDCACWSIPVEFVAMPLAGFVAPVTLVGTLIQHTAETLSGLVISQVARPGAPVLYGGSPAIFDVRYETTPMGAMETMMLDCAYCEIGKRLGLPTQAYIGMSDAKRLDAQLGLESGIGAVLAALAGINSVSGPGMLDFENCLSLEKLVLDDELCGMALRLVRGIEPKEDFPALALFEELLREKHLLIADHTRRYFREEILLPGPIIDRMRRSRWEAEGAPSLEARASAQVQRLLAAYEPSGLSDSIRHDLTERMTYEARQHGMDELPARD